MFYRYDVWLTDETGQFTASSAHPIEVQEPCTDSGTNGERAASSSEYVLACDLLSLSSGCSLILCARFLGRFAIDGC